MPHVEDFVKQRVGSNDLAIAVRQQEQLSYFTQSSIQEDLPESYFNDWAERNHTTSDRFLNHAKNIFRADNFLTFAKYLRTPIISAELVDNRIKPELKRVFFSENSYFNYSIRGENSHSIDELDSKKFDKTLFNALIFNHNDIVVVNVPKPNTPKREVISISNVVALRSSDSVIHQIAYSAIIDGVQGFMYMDEFQYAFFDKASNIIGESIPHDLGRTPADYVSNEAFSQDSDIVRKSIFSKVIRRLENYVLLDNMLRMTEANGVIPVTTMLETKIKGDSNDTKSQDKGEPSSTSLIQGQKASVVKSVQPSKNLAQAGSTLTIPLQRDTDTGKINMDVVKDYITFHHMPIEPLEFIQERVDRQERTVILSTIGAFSEISEAAKNELQVSQGYKSREDHLREFSVAISDIRKASDFNMLALQHGKDNVSVDLFFGSDFFEESQEKLNELFNSAGNPMERTNVLIKSVMNRTRFNQSKMKRDVLLYKLIPYAADEDFKTAREALIVDDITAKYQTQFMHWIGLFEARFGDIVEFFEGIEKSDSERIEIINILTIENIKENEQTNNSTP